MKPLAVSGIQASGNLHIGNYIGAIKQFVELQNKYKIFVFVADLHAITTPQDPKKLLEQTLNAVYTYLACGLDPKKTTIFIQSHVPQHTELGWILNTITPLGELERMTQFKEKKAEHGVLAGLLNYPTLMAADILLYQPDVVPVGEDQLQHLEFARTIARKFNARFGVTFKEPQSYVNNDTKRIMALDDPTKKMSKSAESKNNYISLLDSSDEIRRKIKIAVTDSNSEIGFNPVESPAVANLMHIYSAFSGLPTNRVISTFSGKKYSEFKIELSDLLVDKLASVQKKYKKIAEDKAGVLKILKDGAEKARSAAEATMKDVRAKIGLLES